MLFHGDYVHCTNILMGKWLKLTHTLLMLLMFLMLLLNVAFSENRKCLLCRLLKCCVVYVEILLYLLCEKYGVRLQERFCDLMKW